jgi:hypothetical protein
MAPLGILPAHTCPTSFATTSVETVLVNPRLVGPAGNPPETLNAPSRDLFRPTSATIRFLTGTGARRLKESAAACYILWCADRHLSMVVHTSPGPKQNRHPKAWGGPTPHESGGSRSAWPRAPRHRIVSRHPPIAPSRADSAHLWPNPQASLRGGVPRGSLDSRPPSAMASTRRGPASVRQTPLRGNPG